MPLFLSLILGLGVCLIYLSCFPDNGKPPKPSNDPALVVALRKAGMHSLTPRTFMWVSVASGVTASSLESIPLQREPLHLAFPRRIAESLPPGYSFESLVKALEPLGYLSAPLAMIRNADRYYLRCAGLDPETLCYATSYSNLRKLLNRQFAYGVIPAGFIDKTDTFAHVPIRPAAYYTL